MKTIKSENSTRKLLLRKILCNLGYRFRKKYNKLIDKPDIAFIRCKFAIFLDGKFWNGYEFENNNFGIKKEYWRRKIERNPHKDEEFNNIFSEMGWRVLRL